jgi:FixJ family two-component response regulator
MLRANKLLAGSKIVKPEKSQPSSIIGKKNLEQSPSESEASVVSNIEKQTLTVCLLDDDPSVVKATSRLLISAGWEVEAFTDPIEFLDHAETRQPPVVILDILMPVMNGLEVQERLRNVSPTSRVIILTSKDDPSVRAKAMQQGATAFFLKPLRDDELLSEVESAHNRN